MRLFGNFLQFAAIGGALVLIGNLLPGYIFQYYTWISHILLCVNLTMWILLLIQDYFFMAKVNPKNKAVLITGCDTGFGNAMARILDRRGYKVFACCLDKTCHGASELKEVCSSNLSVIQMDVTDGLSVSTAVKLVREELKNSKLWAIVNNAGVLRGFLTEFSSMKDYDMCLQVNTLGMIRVTKAFLPMLRNSKGRVINICSLAGRRRAPWIGAYSISKSAAVAFSEVLRQEMRQFGVRVISIEPEFFKSPMCSEEQCRLVLKESFTEIEDEVISSYGKNFLEKAEKIYRGIFQNPSPDVKRVYDAIEAAVMLQNPCDIYAPRRNIYITCLFMIAERIPTVLSDVTLMIMFSIFGLPSPSKGLNVLSTLLNM